MSRLPSYYNMCFSRVQSLKFRLKNWTLPMFNKPQNLKGLDVNFVQDLFKQCSHVQTFLLLCRTKPYGLLLHIIE